jgi:hypothetical protein
VYSTRKLPQQSIRGPGITVYCLKDETDADSRNRTAGSTRELWRTLDVTIEGWLRGVGLGDNPDDALDAFDLQIEQVLHADETFGGVCGNSLLMGTEFEVYEEGDKAIGWLSVSLKVWFNTLAPDDQDTSGPALNQVSATWGVNGQTIPTTDNASDLVTGLQSDPAPVLTEEIY